MDKNTNLEIWQKLIHKAAGIDCKIDNIETITDVETSEKITLYQIKNRWMTKDTLFSEYYIRDTDPSIPAA